MSNQDELDKQKNEDNRKSRRLIRLVCFGFVLSTVAAIFMPLLVTSLSLGNLGVSNSNEIGDTIGGIMGPTVGLIGAFLTFLAFYAQIKANTEQRHQFRQSLLQQEDALKEQTVQFTKTFDQQKSASETQKEQADEQLRIAKKQAKDAQDGFLIQDIAAREEHFANRYYMMLSVHRDNVAALDVGRPNNRYSGRRAFLSLFNELTFLYWAALAFHNNDWVPMRKKDKLHLEEIFQVSYLTFFFGFGNISSPMVFDLVSDRLVEFTQELHEHYIDIKKKKQYTTIGAQNRRVVYENEYDLGTGHLRRLSHYFRHLYQTVKYVDDQNSQVLSYEKKYEYVSNLRAQLSVHEQLLLYYNARSVLGQPWLEFEKEKGKKEGLLSRYCMIKSIPLNTADFFEEPEKHFGEFNQEGKAMFEWTEIKRRIRNLPIK